jgi:hypothetical protein
MSLQIELLVNHDQRVLAAVEAFVSEALRQATLAKVVATLAQSVGESPYVLRFRPRSARPQLRPRAVRNAVELDTDALPVSLRHA